ncbi:hypothetical protein SD71_16815 [Cohnella kolymensis]|uniref:Uncharacterized protein n=1 Tax=Cohnella kolymensis TaxID=1590652 RepID=A0ABR5A104_9BACL|nr:hypothetical protein [Cohnella kolymensis]KIL34726.1 hypothetical protein SD71_16815 [Cohnella kolymensis]
MPYVLKHAPTGTILACVQRNGYELAYYGVLLWEQPPTAAQMPEALAEAGIAPDEVAGKVQDWEPLVLTEHDVKMANVKLRNDPRRVLVYRNGSLHAQ